MSVKGRVAIYVIVIFIGACSFLLYSYSPYLFSSGAELLPNDLPVSALCTETIQGAVVAKNLKSDSHLLVSVQALVDGSEVEESTFVQRGTYSIQVTGNPDKDTVWHVETIHYGSKGELARVVNDISGIGCNATVTMDVSL